MSHDNPTCIELQKEVQSLRVQLENERDAAQRFLHVASTSLKMLAEEAMRENERAKSELLEKLNQSQRLSMIGSWEWDLRTNQIWWSNETYRIFGVTPENYVPNFESNGNFIHPDDFARYKDAFEHSLQTGVPLELDVNLIIGDGILKRCNAKGRIVYDDFGQPLRFLGTIMDITERNRAEEKLRESEERFRSLIESAPEAIFVQCAGRFAYLNPAACRLFGASRPEELLGKEFMERMAPEYLDQIRERIRFQRETGKPAPFMEQEYLRLDGSRVPVETTGIAIRYQGKDAHLVFIREITERKRAEEAIEASCRVAEASKRRYEEVVSMIADIVWRYEVDDQSQFVCSYISPVADRFLGLPAGTIGDSFEKYFSYIHPENLPDAEEEFNKGVHDLAKDLAVEYRLCRPDGTTRWVRSTRSAYLQPDGHVVVFGTTTDITARKLAEDALRKSEKMYRVIVEMANEGIWSLDAEYRTTFVNRQMADMLGYSAESLLCRPVTEFMFEEDLSDHQAQAESRKRGMSGNYERRFRRKDGSDCWTVISATSMCDADGQFAGSFAMVTDISARKKDENRLAALEMQLNHASRLATLGELAAGIAHEVNQPLCTIVNYAKACKNTLSCETPDLLKIYQWSDAIASAAAQSGDIIRGMLGFARRHGSAHMMVDVRQLVADAMLLVGHEAKTRKIAMQQEMYNQGLTVWADPIQLHQVLVNLLRNAMDAFHDLTLTDKRILVQARRVDGLVQVSVSDNGAGLPEEELVKIFDPFFTTKPHGLGLGLPISKSIIEDLRGKIWVTVNREAGLTFHFTLPEGKDNPQDVPN